MKSGYPEEIVQDLEKPQGVASRATNLENAEKRLAWRSEVDYKEGFEKATNWYFEQNWKGFR